MDWCQNWAISISNKTHIVHTMCNLCLPESLHNNVCLHCWWWTIPVSEADMCRYLLATGISNTACWTVYSFLTSRNQQLPCMDADYNSHPRLGIIAVLMWSFWPPSISNNCDCWHSLKVVSTTFSTFPFLFASLKHSLWQLSFNFLGYKPLCVNVYFDKETTPTDPIKPHHLLPSVLALLLHLLSKISSLYWL